MSNLTFGRYIIQLRDKLGMSQRKLAEKAGLTNSTISRIEADLVQPDPGTLEKLACALNVEKSLLLTKCGYSEMPEEVVVIARKTGDLSEEQRKQVYEIFNKTIDLFLREDDKDEEE